MQSRRQFVAQPRRIRAVQHVVGCLGYTCRAAARLYRQSLTGC
jgi:hypothetical protein